ncbi:MAG: cation:proton antiporter [Spirochaetae bacterium HGW-Spirochaetae-1]|jgi:multicomponent Na+:H+ antiporter subunit G|nr:MAG: cation:proton antiporter [Spirochaetae bacterium HGW-Spirochaetae-1]
MEITAYVLIGIGLFISSMSVVGLMRFPDIYTRLHAATKTTTFGSIFIVAGIILRNFVHTDNASIIIMVHAMLALLVIIFTNPISAHAIARASLLSGIKPFGVKINEFEEQQKKFNKENRL